MLHKITVSTDRDGELVWWYTDERSDDIINTITKYLATYDTEEEYHSANSDEDLIVEDEDEDDDNEIIWEDDPPDDPIDDRIDRGEN